MAAPPTYISFGDIERWGPDSPPNIRWHFDPESMPRVDHKRVVAIVTKDLDFRFLFEDEATAHEVDAVLTDAMRATGYAVADK